jgi:hypothetical protein
MSRLLTTLVLILLLVTLAQPTFAGLTVDVGAAGGHGYLQHPQAVASGLLHHRGATSMRPRQDVAWAPK